MGLRRPKIFSRISPVDTGGMTSGRRTKVSTTLLSGHSLRAKSQARTMPKGRIMRVLASPTAREKKVICQVSREKITFQGHCRELIDYHETEFLERRFARGTQHKGHEIAGRVFF